MYRNCPEHPKIKEILRKGEISIHYPYIDICDKSTNLQEMQTIYMQEDVFAEICSKRKAIKK